MEFGQLRCRIGPDFRPEGIRVAFQDDLAGSRRDGVFVDIPFTKAFDIANPDAISLIAARHGIGRFVPVIEITDNTDSLCMRCPHGKAHAGLAPVRRKMRTKEAVAAVIGSLMIQVRTIIIDGTEFHPCTPPLFQHLTGFRCQISDAYWRIVRSLEKYPEWAILTALEWSH